jgi:putative RecB family exonuclease
MQCPLLYRFRVIDRLPQAPSAAAARGTLVHQVLERLFDLPAGGRTIEAAAAMVEPQWAALLQDEPELGDWSTRRTRPRWRAGSATPSR